MSRLLVAVSPHGFGHLAQTAAVLNALHALRPDVTLVLRTRLPHSLLSRRIHAPFVLQEAADDFGMVQHTALDVDVAASAERYAALHADWDTQVAGVARELEQAGADRVLADVPYLTLAAAERAGVPAVAMCCLNWADIYRHYCAERPEAAAILATMEAAYNSAQRFLRTEPAMPMPFLRNAYDIGPVVQTGTRRRAEIERVIGAPVKRLVLVATGGIHLRLPMENWPHMPGLFWIAQRDWQVQREDVVTFESLGLSFADVLASCDLLITKPGYGSFTEAAACGVPVLYLPREGWPEAPYLERWLQQHGRCAAAPETAFRDGTFWEMAVTLMDNGGAPPVFPSGTETAVAILSAQLPG